MERPLDFLQALEKALKSEMRHIITPAENCEQVKSNLGYAIKKFTDHFSDENMAHTNNYLFLVRNPEVLNGHTLPQEKLENFHRVREIAITGYSLYGLLKQVVPKTEEVEDWEELQKIKAISNYLVENSFAEFDKIPFSEIASRDSQLLDLLFKN